MTDATDHETTDDTTRDHEHGVAGRFGARAAAYVASAAHAEGDDLAQLAGLAKARPGATALDLGCGGGHAAYALAAQGATVLALDLSEAMLAAVTAEASRRGLSARIHTRQGSVQALPLRDAGFDLVVSRFSAHHWADLPGALREARRVLAPGGLAVFIDTVAPEAALLDTHLQAWELLRDSSHARNHTAAQWRTRLAEAGFVPGRPVLRRLRLDFPAWIARMATPAPERDAIRRLQAGAPAPVRTHFALEPDGSFTIDVMTIEAEGDGT